MPAVGNRPVKLEREVQRTRLNEERIGRHFDDRIRRHASEIKSAQTDLTRIKSVAVDDKKYTLANGSELRSLDVSTATLGDVANALHTLLADLKSAGILK